MQTTGYAQVRPELSRSDLYNASERGSREMFIIDMNLANGRRYITSVSTASGVATTRNRFGATGGTVSNWRRDQLAEDGVFEWRLNERYAL